MTPFEAYQLYISLKTHFTTEKFDIIKYNGKSNTKYSNFLKRKDKFFFEKLAKHPDPKGLLISSLIESSIFWIGEVFQDNLSEKRYVSWKKRVQSLEYLFKSQLSNVEQSDFMCINGDSPNILTLYMKKEIDIETLVVLIDVLECFSVLDKHLKDDFIWKNVRLMIKKYPMLLQYDKNRYKKIIREHFAVDMENRV